MRLRVNRSADVVCNFNCLLKLKGRSGNISERVYNRVVVTTDD